jgi:hypothetical protein
MELTPEDALRINVLLAGKLKAVRIDESKMILHALSDRGEARISLNPNCRDEAYLKRVRETLSSHVLGSPGGYPIYLKRWTRMGQARDGILESLLLLGEPEAVVAVVNATGITDELASRAWWASQTAENARCMLRQQAVVNGQMGPALAQFLIEFLPFEEEARDQIRSVRLVLQGQLISAEERRRLWEKGRHKNAYIVGFLQAVPDRLPEEAVAHPDGSRCGHLLDVLAGDGNLYARQLYRLLSPAGQGFLAAVESVLAKPANQDVMVELMRALAGYSAGLPLARCRVTTIDDIERETDRILQSPTDSQLSELLRAIPDNVHHIRAMLFLAALDEPVLDPIFSRTDAIGTVMRKKLQPLVEPVMQQLRVLRSL